MASPTPGSNSGFYVSPGGNDSNSGSSTSPWQTINHAASMVQPGDVVHVLPGTYGAVTTSVSGTASARIRFVSDVKWGALIRTTGVQQMWYNTGDYVDIVGFDVSGDGRLGILNMGSFVRTIGNNVHNIPASCTSNGGAGIDNANYSASDDDVIGNVVHDIGDPSVQCYSVQGIYQSNLRGHVVNNLSYRNQAWGIQLWHAATDVVISNNLVFQNGAGGIIVGDGDSPGGVTAANCIVTNNIVLYHNSSWGSGIAIYESGATAPSNVYENNLIWGNKQGLVLQNGLLGQNTISADPLLVDYQPDGSGNYHLQATSPAVNAGTTLGMPAQDFDGAPRPFGPAPDIGMYEFGSTPAPWPYE